MKKFLFTLMALSLVVPSAYAARKKPHVVITKPVPVQPVHPIAVLAFVAPPLLVFYDLHRRASCDGDYLGLGGPGFDGKPTPPTNVMIPAMERGACGQPKRY
jgi:hypothetical protein